jgi:hypothetical protein
LQHLPYSAGHRREESADSKNPAGRGSLNTPLRR